jgi:SpoVK/Ycf46/Vps4 family AAA+-type ATPase
VSTVDTPPTTDSAAPVVVERPPLPAWFPDWARRLADLYFSGSTCVFVLHGNVHDLVYVEQEGQGRYSGLVDFLANAVFGSWDVVLRHDLSHGLRSSAGDDPQRLQSMMKYLSARLGAPTNWSRDPDAILVTLDALVERNLLEAEAGDRKSLALLFEYAQYLVPAGDVTSLAGTFGARLVRFLQWAQNPYVKRTNVAFCLVVDQLAEVNQRLLHSHHVATIEVPVPDEAARRRFVDWSIPDGELEGLSDLGREQLSAGSNGLTLTSLGNVLSQARRSKVRLSATKFRELKKSVIERQAGGLLEFVEPPHTLDLVVGQEAAKQRLKEDAEFLAAGRLEAAPMGYLLCGAVGTGKSFLAECYAGSIGIPCVVLKNFRSKYVGETEANLERILGVLRSLGPVVVIVDEADAALGDRTSSGDSGTSNRVFSMIASQMGNTRYRGKIVWMLLTCRPDLLPIDLKRQGRAEVHIPLFYPDDPDEVREMFVVMGRKNKVPFPAEAVPDPAGLPPLSGADIEGIVLSARRRMLTEGRTEATAEDLAVVAERFVPSADGAEKELQEIAAVLECTDVEFLPERWRDEVTETGGRTRLQSRLSSLRALVDD